LDAYKQSAIAEERADALDQKANEENADAQEGRESASNQE